MPTSKLDISEWLAVEPAPDIVAVGFQEIVPLSASNVVMGAQAPHHASLYPASNAHLCIWHKRVSLMFEHTAMLEISKLQGRDFKQLLSGRCPSGGGGCLGCLDHDNHQ